MTVVDIIMAAVAAFSIAALIACMRRPRTVEAPFFDDKFFRRSLDPLCVVRRDGRILRVNRALAEALGYDVDDLLATSFYDLVHSDDRGRTISGLRGLGNSPSIISFENQLSCRDGSVRHLSWRFFPSPDGDVYGMAQDKTDQVLREESLRELNDDLEQLLYIASHDLREPLVGAAGFISLVMTKYSGSLKPEAADFLKEALDGIRLMEKKIDDLLLLSRAGHIGTDENFLISDAIRDAMASLNGRLLDVEVSLDMDEDADADRVVGSRVMVGQVVQNILGNALKYRSSDRSLRVSVRVVRDGRFVKASISDNGIGFDPRQAERVFQAFQRLHSSDSPYSGTGIGLALCRKIVTRHGGSIWAESVEGKGSTFHFTIPARKDGEDGNLAD